MSFLLHDDRCFVGDIGRWGTEMAKKITRIRPWTKGRGPHAEDARARADEDNRDRAQAQAERGCGVSAGVKAGRDVGRSTREEGGVTCRVISLGGACRAADVVGDSTRILIRAPSMSWEPEECDG
jgi:hypothetical protein